MAKYRRKSATVDAWRLGAPLTAPQLSGKVVRVGSLGDWLVAYGNGHFVVELEETFDREYERVEERELLNDCVLCNKPVFKGDDPAYDFGQWYHRACLEKAYRIKHENEVERARDLLAREDAAAKKPTGPAFCVDCGCDLHMDIDELSPQYRESGIVCNPRYRKRAARKSEKPKPLTLGDLSPGDVWISKEPAGCTGPRQLLRWKGYESFCAGCGDVQKYYDSRWPSRIIAHHTLTPKQLLWIDATPEERKALEDSIRDKWLPRTRGEAKSAGKCALCSRHEIAGGLMHKCGDCLLGKAGETCTAPGSPWKSWRNQIRGKAMLEDDWAPYSDQEYDTARRMALSLSNFLPNISPLRLEVEATPVEWPGTKGK